MANALKSSLGVFGVLSLGVAATSLAGGQEFDFKDPKGVNAIVFMVDSTLEPIVGLASGVTGTVSFNPADPKTTTGTISVQAKKLHTENSGMKGSLHGTDWLDVEKNPSIDFKIKEVKEVKKEKDNAWELQVVGDFTCKGVTKALTVPVKVNYLKDKLASRTQGKEGDLLVVRSEFTIKRSDFKIKPDVSKDVVGDEIVVNVMIAGSCPKKS